MKRERLSTAETLGWSVVGFGLGLAGGLWAAGRLGRITPGRLADELRAPHAPVGGARAWPSRRQFAPPSPRTRS